MGDGQRRIPPPVTGEGSGVSRLSILQSQGSKNRDSQERVEVLCSLPWLEQKGENCACHEHAFESCDEWVLADRLLKYTEENIQKQRDLDNKPGADKTLKSGCSMQTKPKSSSDVKAEKEDSKNNDMEISCSQGLNHAVGFIGLINVSKGKKQKAESVVEKESVSTGKLVKIWIPSILRKQLVDDCEYVTKQDKLVKFPRSLNVDEILKQYLESKSQSDDT